jgi:hypothetical protein
VIDKSSRVTWRIGCVGRLMQAVSLRFVPDTIEVVDPFRHERFS